MDVIPKREREDTQNVVESKQRTVSVDDAVIELSTSSSSSSDTDSDVDVDLGELVRVIANGEKSTDAVTHNGGSGLLSKRKDGDGSGGILPVGFLKPLTRERTPLPIPETVAQSEMPELVATGRASDNAALGVKVIGKSCKQFWKAGDYEGDPRTDWTASTAGMDHVRVHPKFLHSNATSHKWALGAFAELLDNALDEVCNGATYVNIDVIVSKKDNSRMFLIEDNGGGMDPDKMRQCMSLGYSVKSKMANTIGQYGNGFKTSTMRLGADVIVLSRCRGKDGISPTQSIGLLSYTFLRSTGKEDIVVPMIDYERVGREWNKIIRSTSDDWNKNVETIVQWSPFTSESDVLNQFNMMNDQGTRIIVYNLWEDDQGQLELDFHSDPHDIQIQGVNREEKNVQMANLFPNSRHFLTYRHSLRSYASILYLRIPPGFRIILRGKDVDHHNIVNDMMLSQEITYRPQFGADVVPKESNMVAIVTIGFVKDAKHHINVSGFNVYHKNRLIKPFWRLWNPAGSGGRGVIGVLEANFVEPAHDKQGFERTIVLSRLEARLIQMQKTYWSSNCHKIGYVSNRNKKAVDESMDEDFLPDHLQQSSLSVVKNSVSTGKATPVADDLFYNLKQKGKESGKSSKSQKMPPLDKSKRKNEHSSVSEEDSDDMHIVSRKRQSIDKIHESSSPEKYLGKSGRTRSALNSNEAIAKEAVASGGSNLQVNGIPKLQLADYNLLTLERLKEENQQLKERLQKKEEDLFGETVQDLQYQRDKCKSLETEIKIAQQKIEDLNKEHENIIDIFSEERNRRDAEERNLRTKLQEASNTIQELLDKVKLLEKMKPFVPKRER